MKYVNLFFRYLVINFSTLMEYKVSFIGIVGASVFGLLTSILFWQTIFSFSSSINGWTLGQVFVIQGFMFMFKGFFWIFFHGIEHFDEEVLDGGLDKYLSRPINPVVGHLFSQMDLFSIDDFIMSILYFSVGAYFGAQLIFPNFLAGMLILLLGGIIVAFIMMTLSFSVFWFGRTAAIWGLWSIIWNVEDYPATIFPSSIQIALTVILPIFFLQTYPAMLALNAMDWSLFGRILLLEVGLIGVWFFIMSFVWKRGMKRYESYGG